MDDLRHPEAVAGREVGRRLARPDPVGEAGRRERPHEMADVERHVVRLEDVPAGRVERIGHLGQLQELLQVVDRAVASLVADPHERRPLGRAEDHAVAADDEIARRVPRSQRELGRRLRGLRA